jgi:hypothetical protein
MRRDRGAWFKPAMTIAVLAALVAFPLGIGNPVAGGLVGAGALLLFAAALLLPRPRPPRVSLDDVRLPDAVLRGPRFPMRRPRAAVTAWTIFAVVMLTSAVLLAIMAVTERQPKNLVGTGLLGLFGTVFVLAVVAYVRRDRTNPPGITVAEPGIVVVGNAARLITWDEIDDVTAAVQDLMSGWWSVRQNVIGIDVRDAPESRRVRFGLLASWMVGNGDAEVRTVQLDTDPVTTYYALRFYWRNPDSRRELGSEVAVERIRSGRLAG